MIILDTNALVRLLTHKEKSDDAARFRGMTAGAKKSGIVIGIPAPAFAEFLVRTDDATFEYLTVVERKQAIKVLPFDRRAAHECALLDRHALETGRKKGDSSKAWQHVKIDRQIVAIAKVANAAQIISGDLDLRTLALRTGLNAINVDDLPIPTEGKQRELGLEGDEAP